MYAVTICINTDEDFSYEDSEFNTEYDEEKVFYFENRKDAANAIVRSFHNLKNSLLPCGIDNVKRWIDSMDNRIDLISKKFKTFKIEKDFGNQSILYKLCEVNKKELINNKSYCYDFSDVEVDFSWYEEETIRWDDVVNFPDVE